MVTYLVRGIGEHKNYLLSALSDTAKADSKTVTAKNGEDNANGFSTEFSFYISCNIVNGCVVTLRSCNDSLCHSYYITVTDCKTVILRSLKNRISNDINNVITVTDNRGANAS